MSTPCPLLFSVNFPSEYPIHPPKVEIETSDGVTRFHPNLYVTGKVCLSILGTFSGPKWSSIMNLESIFMSIYSLLNDNPITNEPGWEKYTLADSKAFGYAECVQFNLIKHIVHENARYIASSEHPWHSFEGFDEAWKKHWLGLKAIIMKKAEGGDTEFVNIPYGMKGVTNWKRLAAEISTQ